MFRSRRTRTFGICATLAAALSLSGCGDEASDSGATNPGTAADAGSDSSGGDEPWGERDASSSHDTDPDSGSWGPAEDASGWGGADAAADAAPSDAADAGPQGNTNVNLGGEQDFGYFRRLLDSGIVPRPDQFEAAGFFAEHHTPLPEPDCGERICLQSMLAVLSNLINGNNCTMVQLGLNSPLVADPANRPPLDLTVVVDVSGSMDEDGKITFVRQGLDILVDAMRDEDRLALVTYSNGADVAMPLTSVSLNRRRMRDAVARLDAGGGTNLYDGLRAGYELALAGYDSGRQTRVILLSDGQPTVGITSVDSILAMSGSYNRQGIGITSIGLGTSFDIDLMRGIAEQGDGNFYFLENSGAVEEVFEEEISYFTVPVAYDLVLELAEGSDYEIGAVHGSRMWAATSEGGRLEIPSVFLAHRVSHDDVHEGGGRRGGGSALMIELMPKLDGDDGSGLSRGDVGTATLRFREPGTDRIVTQIVPIEYPFAPWILLDRGHFDAPGDRTDIIQKSFVMLNIFVAMKMATQAFYQRGDAVSEIEIIENLIVAVEDYNEEIGDVDMEYDLALLRQLVQVLLDNGAVPLPPEWEPPADPWPAD